MPNWLPILQRKGCPVLFYSYINSGYKDVYHQEILGIPQGINFHQYVDGWVIIDTETSVAFNQTFSARLDEDGYQEFFFMQGRRLSDSLLAFGEQLRNRDYSASSTSSLLLDFMEFSSQSIRLMPFLTTMVLLQGVVEEKLREALSQAWKLDRNSEELSMRMQELMLEGHEVPLATQSVRALMGLADLIRRVHPDLYQQWILNGKRPDLDEIAQKYPELFERIANFLRDFDFLGTDYYVGEPLSAESLLTQLEAVLPHKSSESASKEDEAKLLSPHDQRLVQTARELHFLRQHRIEALFKSGRDARNLLSEIGRRIGLSYDELLYLTFQEVQQSLTRGQVIIPFELLSERMRDYGIVIEYSVDRIVVGQELANLRSQLPVETRKERVLTGVAAFPGECEGTARVVDHRRDVGIVQAGDVLVAPMTSPYHVPAMTKSNAVVTNEGGILSHAAIVSRELRIPCIVGVANATEIIHSGQRVRVHASRSVGTVEILDA